MSARTDLAAWARAELAAGVAEVPKGSNDGPPMERYALAGEQPLSWCARFARTGLLASDLIRRPGASGHGVVLSLHDLYAMAAAATMYKLLVELGALRVVGGDAQPGDLRFLLGRGGSDPLTASESDGGIHHVGVYVGDGKCVDGNWADAVCLNTQVLTDPIALFLRFPPDPN